MTFGCQVAQLIMKIHVFTLATAVFSCVYAVHIRGIFYRWTVRACSLALCSTFGLGASQLCTAIGPIEVPLTITRYQQVDLCNGQKPIMPGQKAAEGLYPVCIEVSADYMNPVQRELKDVSVYGFVKDDAAGNSVLPNNPDFRSDAGQYAMIKVVPPGSGQLTYEFVAAVADDPTVKPVPKLTFLNTKAVSYPGGERFKPLTACEIDPFAEECSGVE